MDAEIWVVSLQQAANEITILLPRGRSLCVLPSCFFFFFCFVLFLAPTGSHIPVRSRCSIPGLVTGFNR